MRQGQPALAQPEGQIVEGALPGQAFQVGLRRQRIRRRPPVHERVRRL